MRILKAASNSIIGVFNLVDTSVRATNHIACMAEDACKTVRLEQQFEDKHTLKKMAEEYKLSEEDITKALSELKIA